jgi:hypothetical protein
MKSLQRALIDYDMAMLRAIAAARGLSLPGNRHSEALATLMAALVSPVAMDEVVTKLSAKEREALATLARAGGRMPAAAFARRYGTIPHIGPGRLEREAPWQSPASAAEHLWFLGLIYQGFDQVDGEPVEVVYLPDELLPLACTLLAEPQDEACGAGTGVPRPEGAPEPPFAAIVVSAPATTMPGGPALAEDLCTLLSYMQNNRVRPHPDGSLSLDDLRRLASCLLYPQDVSGARHESETGRLAFLLHLARRLKLLTLHKGRLRPDAEVVPPWLKQRRDQQLGILQQTWSDDPTWNDLWRVPSLRCEETGWSNNPLLARRRILKHLVHCPAGEWLSLPGFIQAIKEADPDFQRPSADYETWYILDAETGEYLMGFQAWDRVEGALIAYLITGPLHWLGAVDLGMDGEGRVTREEGAFRIAPWASAGLELPGGPPPELPIEPIRVRTEPLTILVPVGASLYDRFQVERFANLVERGEETLRDEPQGAALAYRVTPASMACAHRQGINAARIAAFLERASGNPLPPGFVAALEKCARVRLRQEVVLQVTDPLALQELQEHPEVRQYLAEVLGPTSALVRRREVTRLLAALKELGYLADADWAREEGATFACTCGAGTGDESEV